MVGFLAGSGLFKGKKIVHVSAEFAPQGAEEMFDQFWRIKIFCRILLN